MLHYPLSWLSVSKRSFSSTNKSFTTYTWWRLLKLVDNSIFKSKSSLQRLNLFPLFFLLESLRETMKNQRCILFRLSVPRRGLEYLSPHRSVDQCCFPIPVNQ